jgi:hypothetical protein
VQRIENIPISIRKQKKLYIKKNFKKNPKPNQRNKTMEWPYQRKSWTLLGANASF